MRGASRRRGALRRKVARGTIRAPRALRAGRMRFEPLRPFRRGYAITVRRNFLWFDAPNVRTAVPKRTLLALRLVILFASRLV